MFTTAIPTCFWDLHVWNLIYYLFVSFFGNPGCKFAKSISCCLDYKLTLLCLFVMQLWSLCNINYYTITKLRACTLECWEALLSTFCFTEIEIESHQSQVIPSFWCLVDHRRCSNCSASLTWLKKNKKMKLNNITYCLVAGVLLAHDFG